MVCAGGLIFIPFQFIYCLLRRNIFTKISPTTPTVFQLKALSNSSIVMSVLHWEFRIFGCWTIRAAKEQECLRHNLSIKKLQFIEHKIFMRQTNVLFTLSLYMSKIPHVSASDYGKRNWMTTHIQIPKTDQIQNPACKWIFQSFWVLRFHCPLPPTAFAYNTQNYNVWNYC